MRSFIFFVRALRSFIPGAILVHFLFSCSNPPPAGRNSLLHGMFRLHTVERQDSAGNWQKESLISGDGGYIVYDGIGHMAVEITPASFPRLNWLAEEDALKLDKVTAKMDSLPVDSLKATLLTFCSNYVYFGNYSVSDSADVVTHQRLSGTIPAVWNTSVQRKFSFHGDTIILEPLTVKRRLKWIRMNP